MVVSTKTFCDACEREIKNNGDARDLQGYTGSIGIVVRTQSPTLHGDDPDVCKYCALDALKKLDDRPAPAVAGENARSHLRAQEGFPIVGSAAVGNYWNDKLADALNRFKDVRPTLADRSPQEVVAFREGWFARGNAEAK